VVEREVLRGLCHRAETHLSKSDLPGKKTVGPPPLTFVEYVEMQGAEKPRGHVVGALPHHSHQRVLVGACVNLPLMGDSLPDNVRRTPLALAQEGVKHAERELRQLWVQGHTVEAAALDFGGPLVEVHDWIGAATSNNMRETGPSFPGWAMIRLVRPHWHALSLALQRSENGLVSGISSRESLWHILSRPADFGMY
jgi:hypothetical protein